MSFSTARRYVVLGLLIAFVAYFGVWQLCNVMLPALGLGWAVLLAVLAALGLCVIGIVGVVMVRTRAVMEASQDIDRESS